MSKIPLVQAGMAVRLTLRKKFLDSMQAAPVKVAAISVPQPVIVAVAAAIAETVTVEAVAEVAEVAEVAAVVVEPESVSKVDEVATEVATEVAQTAEATEPEPTVVPPATWNAMSSKAELVAAAEKLGIEVPANASKASILKLLSGE
jgi:hypothetical protein